MCTLPRFGELPGPRSLLNGLARELARGAEVDAQRVLNILAASGASVDDLQAMCDRFAHDRLADDGCPHAD